MSAAESSIAHGAMLSPRATQLETAGGRFVDVYRPDPATLSVSDVGRHLSRICRYGGALKPEIDFYSVAEHAVLVHDLLRWQGADDRLLLAALLHDAAEAYLGDVISPLKYALRQQQLDGDAATFVSSASDYLSAYDLLTDKMERAIAAAFGVSVADMNCAALKTADMWALKIEAAALTFSGGAEWRWPGELPNGGLLPSEVTWKGGLAPDDAYTRWIVDLGMTRVRGSQRPAPAPSEGSGDGGE